MAKRTPQSLGIRCLQSDLEGKSLEEYTNIKATIFCPFINHNKKGYMHREFPTGHRDPNRTYHFWQTEDFKTYQNCTLKREPEYTTDLCREHFKLCPLYRERFGLEITMEETRKLELIKVDNKKSKTKRSTISDTKTRDDLDEEDE